MNVAADIAAPGYPTDAAGRRLIGVPGLMGWDLRGGWGALGFDQVAPVSVGGGRGLSAEARSLEQLKLGLRHGTGVRVDTSFGRSLPADDAEIVASVVRAALPWRTALWVADLARAGRVPDWMPDPRPRCEPVEWKNGKNGRRARREKWHGTGTMWPDAAASAKFGWACPVVFHDCAAEIEQARRAYRRWWHALLTVRQALQGVELQRHCLTSALPPGAPWKKNLDVIPIRLT